MDARRVERLSEQFRLLISGILEKEVSDPRLEFVTVNRVCLSKDGSFATVFFSMIGSEDNIVQSRNAMESASGFIRRELAGKVRLRTVPKLRFVYDRSLEEGEKILGIIREINPD